EVAAELLLRLRERSIGDQLLPFTHANRCRRRRVGELIAPTHRAALLELPRDLAVLVEHRVSLVVRPRRPFLLRPVDQPHVLHAHPLCFEPTPAPRSP